MSETKSKEEGTDRREVGLKSPALQGVGLTFSKFRPNKGKALFIFL